MSMNVLYRTVDALTTVKIHPAVTSAHAQTQSSHWRKTTILVKVDTKHTFCWYTSVQYQQLVAHWMVVTSVRKILERKFRKCNNWFNYRKGRRRLKCYLGPFLSSPAANKRENVLDLQITLDDFLGHSTDFSTSFDLAVKLLIPSLGTLVTWSAITENLVVIININRKGPKMNM